MPLDNTGPIAVPGPNGLLIDPTTGGPAPSDMPDAQGRLGVIPVIDVGTPSPGTPQPGEGGSQYRPVKTGTEAKPGVSLPAQAVAPQPAPAAPAVSQLAPGAAIAPATPAPAAKPTVAGWAQAPNGDWVPAHVAEQEWTAQGTPAATAGAPASAPKTAAPPTISGWVQAPNGDWVTPETAAQEKQTATSPAAEAVPASIKNQEMRNQPWYQGLMDTVQGIVGSTEHGLSMGLDEIVDPIVPAIVRSVNTGKPFTKAYDEVVQEQRQPRKEFERTAPTAATAIELGAGVPAAVATSPLFGTAAPGASLLSRGITGTRNVLASTGLGAATGATMTEGDIGQRAEGAKGGAEAGLLLPPAANVAGRVASAVPRALSPIFRPTANAERVAGQALLERAGGVAPPMQAAPIANMPLDVGQASNNAGLAAQVRQASQAEPIPAQAQRAAQNTAIRQAATEPERGTGIRLSTGETVPQASMNAVSGMQGAWDVVNQEERRLWSDPALTTNRPDLGVIQQRVKQAIAALPQRVQSAIDRAPDVKAALADLYDLKPGAMLADVNDIRSDILAESRSLPFDQRFAKRVADTAAQAVLDAIETNPSLKTDPAAAAAYQRARAFTAGKWDAFGKPQFQSMIQSTSSNRKGLDPATVAESMFKFTKGTERTPGGITKITDLLDNIRQQWNTLPGGGFDPATASAARAELAQGTRDFIIGSMLDTASSQVRDVAGNQNIIMNKLADWIDTNKDWISKSGIFNQSQTDLLSRIRDAAVMAARTENLRGGPGSPTYEFLKGDRYVDAFIGPVLGRTAGMVGGLAIGALATAAFGESSIGAMIGMEIAGGASGHVAGSAILRKIYSMPRDLVMQKLEAAIRDPAIASDLMQKASAARQPRVSPQTREWLRSLLAIQPTAQYQRTLGAEPAQSPSE